MSANRYAFETLESRTLLSATGLYNAAVRADRLQVRADLLRFRADALSASATLLNDRIALKGDDVAAATTVTPLIAKLKSDIGQMRLTLKADRLNEAAVVLADQLLIVGDLRKILADRGNPDAVAADRATLKSHRIQLQNDLIDGLNTRLTTRQNAYTTLFNDGQAIVAAVQTDPGASDKLKADVQTWIADGSAKLNTLAADLQKLVADRTTLVADLTASQG